MSKSVSIYGLGKLPITELKGTVEVVKYSDLKKLLDEDKQEKFGLWMRGQTVADVDGEAGIFVGDIYRWAASGFSTEQGANFD